MASFDHMPAIEWMQNDLRNALCDDAYLMRHRVPELMSLMIGQLLQCKPCNPKELLISTIEAWQFADAGHLAKITVRFATSGEDLMVVNVPPTCIVKDLLQEVANETHDSILDLTPVFNDRVVCLQHRICDVGILDRMTLDLVKAADESMSISSIPELFCINDVYGSIHVPSRDAGAIPIMEGCFHHPRMKAKCCEDTDFADSYANRRRSVEFALNAARAREARIAQLVANGDGATTGCVPQSSKHVVPDARWGTYFRHEQEHFVFEAVAP